MNHEQMKQPLNTASHEGPPPSPIGLGLPAARLTPARLVDDCPPLLLLVIDTEEEFDWSAPFSRASRTVTWIESFESAHQAFVAAGARPTYVVDFPVASDPLSAAIFAKTAAAGGCEVGAHLHPWVTPPDLETVNSFNSYGGNLPPDLEHRKLLNLTSMISQNIGVKPVAFKAGRYGIGSRTPDMLASLGFTIDLSTTPNFDWSGDGGPDHSAASNLTSWIDTTPPILEIPTTGGYFGAFRNLARRINPRENAGRRQRSAYRWALRTLGLGSLAMLTPEGYSLRDMKTLTEQLLDDGVRVFSLSLHSPSLAPGRTPFVRNLDEKRAFIKCVTAYAEWCQRTFGAKPVTASEALRLHADPK